MFRYYIDRWELERHEYPDDEGTFLFPEQLRVK